MKSCLTIAVARRTAAQETAPKRRQLVAWSRPTDEEGSATECGIIRAQGRTASINTFMFAPNGEMHTESGDVVRIDLQEFNASFVSDESVIMDGKEVTGSRWKVASLDMYLFLAWSPSDVEAPNQEGELIVTDRSFTQIEDRWNVTISLWGR